MSVVSVNEIGHGKRRGSLSTAFTRRYSRWFRVITSAATDDHVAVLTAQALGLPARGDAHPSDPLALCLDLNAQELDDPRRWEVEATYSSSADDIDRENADPLLELPDVRWATERWEIVPPRDLDDQPFTNSAGKPFDPPVKMEIGRPVLTISRNEALFDKDRQTRLLYSTNLDPVFGYERGQVLLVQYDGQLQRKNGVNYSRHTYQFKFDKFFGFESLKVLDRGKEYLDAGAFVSATDKVGTPTGEARLLDGDGGLLATGENPVFRTFRIYDARDWAELDLPAV